VNSDFLVTISTLNPIFVIFDPINHVWVSHTILNHPGYNQGVNIFRFGVNKLNFLI
jgi:hypothetical protein